MEWVEGSRLALNTVASVYHVNPTMIGLLDNANYSNVREFRRMLYGDTLGPVIAQIEDRLNTFYVPLVDPRPSVYVEFNIDEKMQGELRGAGGGDVDVGGSSVDDGERGSGDPGLHAGGRGRRRAGDPAGRCWSAGQASPRDSAPPPQC